MSANKESSSLKLVEGEPATPAGKTPDSILGAIAQAATPAGGGTLPSNYTFQSTGLRTEIEARRVRLIGQQEELAAVRRQIDAQDADLDRCIKGCDQLLDTLTNG